MTSVNGLILAAEFDEPTRAAWMVEVDKAIKGGDFDKILVSTTLDGIRIEPLYTADDVAVESDESGFPGFSPLTRGGQISPRVDGAWDIRASIAHPDVAIANAQALTELRNGATSLDLHLDLTGEGAGVSVRSSEDLARLLEGVLLDLAPISIRAGALSTTAAAWLGEVLEARNAVGVLPAGCLGLDPLSTLASQGVLPQTPTEAIAEGVMIARETTTPRVRTFRASAVVAADAGASEGQELAFALGSATTYLRALVSGGLDVSTAAGQIVIELAADVDVFATIAKLRALRHCWSTVLEASGLEVDTQFPGLVQVDAHAGGRWLTVIDPWVNLLRGTSASLGAVVGGADVLTVSAFDSAVGLPSDLGRRLARNTQLLLQDESGIGRVLDPAGGSYYVESLTDALAAEGWKQFQAIEAAGGLEAVLAAGTFQTDVAATAAKRDKLISNRKQAITGVSEFPLIGERRPESSATPPLDSRPGLSQDGTVTTVAPLKARRLAESYEAMRVAAEAAATKPTIFLANIGVGPSYVTRATFSSNLFATGGVDAVGDGGYADAAAAAQAFKGSGATAAVICGTDAAYSEQGVAYAEALKSAGASFIYLAGRAGDAKDQYEAAGIDDFVYMGVDVLSTLQRLHTKLGV
ncbi:MAG: methylmalonyl-CoA mutase subunit beta [Actinomycetota bacterium]|nr:methylmalonyl-CoA mutase subunit beta [Actinomycetota bacterium]